METFKIILLTVAVCVVTSQVTSQQSTGDPPIQIAKPKITRNPTHEVLYSGETVTLHCEVPGGTSELQYDWYKDSANLKTDYQSSITVTNGGNYECKAKNGASESEKSDMYTLTLQVDIPKPVIRKDPLFEFFYTEEKVQLSCNMTGDGWKYDWYKDSKPTEPLITDPTFTISSASLSDTDVYHCKAKRGDFSVDSETLQVRVKNPPQPKLSIEPEWKTFYPTEKVTLKCSIDEDPNDWGYEWFRNGTKLSGVEDFSFSENTLSISSAKASHSGQYTCRGKHLKRTPVTTGQTEALKLHIYVDTPKPVIRKDPLFEFFYTEEKVQLSCNMTGDGWKYDWYKDKIKTLITDPTFTISSASLSDTGYHCKAKRGDFSVDSETLQVRVEKPPQPKLSIESEWKTFYPTEKVTLKCSVDGGSNDWSYEWFRNGAQLSGVEDFSFSGNTLSISSAKASHSGQYTCRGKHLKRTPVTTGQTEALTLHINVDTPKPVIRKDPLFEFFYTEEKVQLGCNMPGDGWKYDWYKDSKPTEPLITDPTFTISSASLSDTDVYHCKAKRGDFSVDSETLQVPIKKPPQPTLSIESEWKTFYPTEKVTLKCSIDGGSNDWGYEWFRNGAQLSGVEDISFSGNTLSISSAKASHSGQYTCRGKHLKRTPVTTGQTEALTLHINDVTPKPVIRKYPLFELFYTEEKVQLSCNMPGDGWKYDWYKDKIKTLITDPTFTISSASPSNTGDYHCKAKRGDFSVDSETLQVRVENPPQPNLSIESEWKTFYPTEKVTLKCSIDGGSNDWDYEWFRNGAQLSGDKDVSFSGNTLSISSAKASHSGQYTCRGKHLKRTPVTTGQTEALKLHIYVDTPKPVIRKHPLFELFYTEEKVQLGCNVPGDGWKYDWYKDSNQTAPLNTDSTFTTSSASPSDTGVYHCKAKRGDFSVDSETLQVRVKEPPQPKLSIESEWKTFYPTEKVTLKCSIDEDPNDWGYEWFRNGAQLSGDEDISFSRNTLSISSAKASHSGPFTCRGKHQKRTPVTTRQTEALTLHINVDTPKPDIRKDQWFEFFYTDEKVQLDCNMTGVGWTYDWYKDSKPLNTDPTITISSASPSNTDYHCKAKRGVFSVDSETLQMRVQARPPAVLSMETELSDIMSGNILTLRCNVSDGRQWSYAWFENGQKLNGSLDVFKVKATEETIKSEFKCKGIRTERPLYSALSEGYTANNIILKRKILLAISGCVVCCLVLMIIGCLVLRITRKPEKKETLPEDLFFSMTDSKKQTASPLEEYMDNGPADIAEIEECEEKEELLTDRVSAVNVDGVIKDEDSPPAEANGLISFKGL